MLKILFVCTGNTCRSPMAEALLKHELRSKELCYQLEAASAGLAVLRDERISKHVVTLLREEKIEYNYQRHAQQLHKELVEEADLILTMTADQLRQLKLRFPESSSRAYLLKEYSGLDPDDIADPYGSNLQKYRQVMEEIHSALQNLIAKLGKVD